MKKIKNALGIAAFIAVLLLPVVLRDTQSEISYTSPGNLPVTNPCTVGENAASNSFDGGAPLLQSGFIVITY